MRKLIWGAALAVISYVTTRLLSSSQLLVEQRYSTTVYPRIAAFLSRTAGRFSFSLAEILLLVFLAFPFVYMLRKPSLKRFIHLLVSYLTTLFVLYFMFVSLWGLNYLRLPLGDIMGLSLRPSSVEELRDLSLYLIEQANEYRLLVREDEHGVMTLNDTRRESLHRVQTGYDIAQGLVPELAGVYSPPKGALISTALSYLGIAGIYSPFTGEAHININMPSSSIPATAVHEAAHQRGFSREDEANFIAYLVCSLHPDADFRYSGTLLALNHTLNALYRADRKVFNEIVILYSDGLRRDLAFVRTFWQRYEGPAERAADRVNDAYLRANQQQDGVASYGRMVDLLLAFARDRGIIGVETDGEAGPEDSRLFVEGSLTARQRQTIISGLEPHEMTYGQARNFMERPARGVTPYSGAVEHIFVHPLIPFPEVTFSHRQANGFDDWFVTSKEFQLLLEELYTRDFVLVNHEDVYEEYMVSGAWRMRRKELWLPEGKKPLIISIDDMNYYTYMREAGLPDKLVLDADGRIALAGRRRDGTEYVSRTACVVPVLDDFVSRFPDFSHKGAKGTIALTGYEGILGYRIQHANPQRHDEQTAVMPVVEQLLKSGWRFASHSWGHRDFSAMSYVNFVTDADRWQTEVGSLIGPTNVMIYPFGASVPQDSPKFAYLLSQGFRVFCAVGPNSFEQMASGRPAVMKDRRAVDGIALRQKRHEDIFAAERVLDLAARPIR